MPRYTRPAAILLLAGIGATAAFGQAAYTAPVASTTASSAPMPAWSPARAAAYLDKRSTWWISWPTSARDHGTFCVSWHDVEPFYSDQARGLPKSSESRGTESILNSLILVSHDVPTSHLSADARLALDNMWALQIKAPDMNGAWAWLQFHNAPFEADSQFYGNCLAAIAIGSAPDSYQSEAAIQPGIKLLIGWLTKNMDAQTPLDRVELLWASAKLHGLLTPEQQNKIVAETLAKQREDGGFSIASMIPGWKRHDNTPIDPASDGYATGLVSYALEQLDAPQAAPQLKHALAWLNTNEIEADGRWPAVSLNNNRPVLSDTGLFMSDAATAYAVLALTNAPVH